MRAVVLVLAAAVCFGSTGTAVALGAPGASSLSVGAARTVLGGALLAALAAAPLLRRPAPGGDHGPPRAGGAPGQDAPGRTSVVGTTVVSAAVVGALGVAAYQPLFFAGTAANGVAVGTVTALGSAPLLTGVLGWVVTGVRPGRRWLAATAVAVVGLVLLTGAGASTGVDPAGVAASVGAGASYAVYTLATKRLLDAGWAPSTAVGAVFGGAALLGLPVLLAGDTTWLADPRSLVAVLWLGGVTTALAYVLFSRGLRELPAATVATLTLAEPLTATALGLAVLGERLSALDAAALILIAAGLVVLAAGGRRRPAVVVGTVPS